MSRTQANLLMLVAAVIWGTTFVAQQLGMRDVGPLTYTGVRFLMGALFVAPLAWHEYVRLKARGIRLERRDLAYWCGIGLLLTGGAVLQQIGIVSTTVSNAGFLTALYVPLVPILGWLLHRHLPHWSLWPAAAGSVAGTYLLGGGELSALSVGDLWIIASTFFWAGHVLYVGRVAAQKGAPILLACTQFVVCGVLSLGLALATETITLAGLSAGLPTILYGGLLSVGIAYTLQVVAQRHTHATDAAILLSSEILFAALAGMLYLGERLNSLQMAGGGLIFASILMVQLLPLWRPARRA
ncbi:MAG: DMT family transporter [Hydrogenophilales bacterium]|nr:DMT family transporter [Hydrogenophilales bacterium]